MRSFDEGNSIISSRKATRCKRRQKLQFAYRTISDNDPLVLRLSIEKKTWMSGTKRSQSVLSRCSPSDEVLLREITVQRATYVINGENDDTRSTRWKEAQCLVGGNSRGNAESMLACHRKSFSCSWCARWTMARKHSRTYPLRAFPQLIYTVLHSTCAHAALHEKLREAATRARRPTLLNVFPPLFFLNHRSRFSLPGQKG